MVGTHGTACKNYGKYLEAKATGADLSAAEQLVNAMDEGLQKAFAGF